MCAKSFLFVVHHDNENLFHWEATKAHFTIAVPKEILFLRPDRLQN